MKTTIVKQSIAIATAIICTATAQAQDKKGSQTYTTERYGINNQYLNIDEDSSVNPPQTIVVYKDAYKKYNFTIANDKITEMYINGHQVPADSFYLYDALVEKVKKQIKADRAQALEDMKQAERDRAQAEEDRKQAVKDQAQAEEDRKQADRDRMQADEDRKQAVRDQAQAELDRQQAVKDQAQAVEEQKQAARDRMQADEDRKQAVRDQAQAEEDRKQAEIDRKQAEEDRKMMKNLVTDIIAEHIAPDEAGIRHVTLNDDEFIVNGKLQSPELLAKFKAKYLKKPNTSFQFNNTPNNHGISISNK